MTPAAALPSVPAKTEISVDVRGAEWRGAAFDVADLCRTAAAEALGSVADISCDGEISIVLADDDFVRELNRTWRHIDAPTNVLAFPCADGRDAPGGSRLLGDVIVAFQTTQREAVALTLSLEHHLAHLIIHGVLHLLGYDHTDDSCAAIMERLEVDALARLGIENPYEEDVLDGEKTSR